MPKIPPLLTLPLCDLPIGHFAIIESRVGGQSFLGIVKHLLWGIFLEKSLSPVHHMLQES